MHIETLSGLFLGKRAVKMLGIRLWLAIRQPTRSTTCTPAAFRVVYGKSKLRIQGQRRAIKREQLKVRS
jgi:hypothetical protein